MENALSELSTLVIIGAGSAIVIGGFVAAVVETCLIVVQSLRRRP